MKRRIARRIVGAVLSGWLAISIARLAVDLYRWSPLALAVAPLVLFGFATLLVRVKSRSGTSGERLAALVDASPFECFVQVDQRKLPRRWKEEIAEKSPVLPPSFTYPFVDASVRIADGAVVVRDAPQWRGLNFAFTAPIEQVKRISTRASKRAVHGGLVRIALTEGAIVLGAHLTLADAEKLAAHLGGLIDVERTAKPDPGP